MYAAGFTEAECSSPEHAEAIVMYAMEMELGGVTRIKGGREGWGGGGAVYIQLLSFFPDFTWAAAGSLGPLTLFAFRQQSCGSG